MDTENNKSTPRPSQFHYWENGEWKFSTELWLDVVLRPRRNALLSACDWAVLPDSPLSSEKLAEWKTYRQSLRDFPAAAVAAEDYSDATNWPNKPE